MGLILEVLTYQKISEAKEGREKSHEETLMRKKGFRMYMQQLSS